MAKEIMDLEPKLLWENFYELTQIPRPSKHEDKIRAFMIEFGKKHGIDTREDEVGNIIMKKAATPGMEDRKGVILQAHLDMVPQKNSSKQHDFETDPIDAYIDGEWVTAKDTTLGADNGIGAAAAMAVFMSDDIPHGPIEALLTADEETGMTGANGIKAGELDGDILLNLDSEDEGELYIGCAGGVNTNAKLPFENVEVPTNVTPYKIFVIGLKGGHSGLDIHLGRGNANKIMNALLMEGAENYGLRLSEIEGGSLRNAIPRESFSIVVIPDDKKDAFKDLVAKFEKEQKDIYKEADPGLIIKLDRTKMPAYVVNEEAQANLFKAVENCPNGLISMEPDMPGVVQTSTNLAIVKSEKGYFELATLQRSQVDDEKDNLSDATVKAFADAGAEVDVSGDYPGWKPDIKSPVLKEMKEIF